MTILIAISHIAGSLIVLSVLSVLILMLGKWEIDRNHRLALQEMSINLGIPLDSLNDINHQNEVIGYAARMYSPELFRNRLSDLCGLLLTMWGWLSNIIQFCILVGVVWFTFTDDLNTSVHSWWIIGVFLTFWILSVAFSYACKLLTGRFPNQAKRARIMLAQVIEEQSTLDKLQTISDD